MKGQGEVKGKLPLRAAQTRWGDRLCGWNRVHLGRLHGACRPAGRQTARRRGEPEREHGVGQGLQICGQEYKQNLGHGRWVQAERAWLRGCWSRARDRGLEPWGCWSPGEQCTKVWQGQGPLGEVGRKKTPPHPPVWELRAEARILRDRCSYPPHGCGVGAGVSSSKAHFHVLNTSPYEP